MNVLSLLTPKDKTFFLSLNSSIRQVLEKFDYYKFSAVPLLDMEGRYLKTVAEGDILRYIMRKHDFNLKMAQDTQVTFIEIYRPYKALDINCKLADIIELSKVQNFIPLIDDRGMYIGIIKRSAIINYLTKKHFL